MAGSHLDGILEDLSESHSLLRFQVGAYPCVELAMVNLSDADISIPRERQFSCAYSDSSFFTSLEVKINIRMKK